MQNWMVIFIYLLFETKNTPFCGKFARKNQNFQLKLKFVT